MLTLGSLVSHLIPDATRQTAVPGGPVLATPGEARAYERGWNDYPLMIESGASYRRGWFDCKRKVDGDRNARAEAARDAQERRDAR